MAVFNHFTEALATLLNSTPARFCPQQNISSGISKWLSGLPPADKRNQILLCQHDFPSVGFALQQAKHKGYDIRFIPSDHNLLDPDTWQTALTQEVFATLITHAHYNSSSLMPVSDICGMAKAQGIVSIVDIAQSVGVVPIDLAQWQADIVVGSCVKWLCGGPGAGFIWLQNPEQWQPQDLGWFSHQNPFEFDIHHFEYADNANRFWGGTPSVLPYAIASNSIKHMHNIGVKTIRQHNQHLTETLRQSVPEHCVVSPNNPEQRGGTLVLKFQQQAQVEAALTEAQVQFDSRKFGIRLSPHIYNTQEQIEVVLGCLCEKE